MHAIETRLGQADGEAMRCIGHDVLKSGTADTAGKRAAIGGGLPGAGPLMPLGRGLAGRPIHDWRLYNLQSGDAAWVQL